MGSVTAERADNRVWVLCARTKKNLKLRSRGTFGGSVISVQA